MAPFREIGQRLHAFRLGRGLAPEALAAQLGISRSALYRAEKGLIAKIETLTRISEILEVSLPTLLGVGVEYVPSAVAFFERMRQMEERCSQIIVLFGPVSYLLTSPRYDTILREVLIESVGGEQAAAPSMEAIDQLMGILAARKRSYLKRRPGIVSLVSAVELERFLHNGLVGRLGLDDRTLQARRAEAAVELRHMLDLIRRPPIGVQIGIVRETMPSASFQIFRQPDGAQVAISPFRLGEQPNVQTGVALITSAQEAIRLHEGIAEDLWRRALKGDAAASFLEALVEQYGRRAESRSPALA